MNQDTPPIVPVPPPDAIAEMFEQWALAYHELAVRLVNLAWAMRAEDERRAA